MLLLQAKAMLRECQQPLGTGRTVDSKHSQMTPPRVESAQSIPRHGSGLQEQVLNVIATSDDVDEGYDLCAICLEHLPDSLFMPCQHCVACNKCAGQIMQKTGQCPMCRCLLQSVVLLHERP